MKRPYAIVLTAWFLAAQAAQGEDVLAEEVVAVVDKRPVLLSELEFEARLERARKLGAATLNASLTPAELRESLSRLIDLVAVQAEAERLQVFDLEPGEAERAVEQLRSKMGANFVVFLTTWGVDDRTLGESVRRDLRVAKYLENRFRLAARPRESDMRAYFAAHPEACPSGASFDACLPTLKPIVTRARLAAMSNAFVSDVRARAQVTILHDFDRPGAERPTSGIVNAAGPESESL